MKTAIIISIMKHGVLPIMCLLLSTTAYSQQPLVNVKARYEGFDLSKYTEVLAGPRNEWKTRRPKGLLTAPQVTMRLGQPAKVEVIREVLLPKSPSRESRTSAGITLDLLAVIKDGQIQISGKSVLRRSLPQASPQPVHSMSFAALETYFNSLVNNGDQLVIPVGDGPKDKARIVLEVKLIDKNGRNVAMEKKVLPSTANGIGERVGERELKPSPSGNPTYGMAANQ